MLRPKVLPKILSQANSNGVKCSTLFNKEGALLAAAGDTPSGKVVAAIFANIWQSFVAKSSQLEFLICDCENGRVAMTKVTDDLFLGLIGDQTAQPGMLKRKAELLKAHLSDPLSKIDKISG